MKEAIWLFLTGCGILFIITLATIATTEPLRADTVAAVASAEEQRRSRCYWIGRYYYCDHY